MTFSPRLTKRTSLRGLELALLGLASSGCGAATPPPPKVEHPAVETDAAAAFASPARWAYFPRDAGTTVATLVLPDDPKSGVRGASGCLVLTTGGGFASGDRWLVHGTPSAPCSGTGVASASPVVGDALVGVTKSASGYRFISQSGAVFDASEPLGAFTHTTLPEQRLSGVSAAAGHMVGVDAGGRAHYFDETASAWRRSAVPLGARVLRAGVDAAGRAVAIALPEKLLVSSDGGRTFASPASTPPQIGATDVARTSAGDLVVVGTMGKLLFEKSGGFSRTTVEVESSGEAIVTPPLTPQVAAFREARAAITGDQYYDLRYPDAAPGPSLGDPTPGLGAPLLDNAATAPYVLVRGPLGGPLETRPLKGVHDCDDFRMGAHGKNVVIACSFAAPDAPSGVGVRLFESTNAGDDYAELAELVTPSFGEVNVAVGADGAALVTNVCRPGGEKRRHTGRGDEADDTCKPKGPLYLHPSAGSGGAAKPTIVAGSAAHFAYGSFSPAIAPDGRLYFVGRRAKDDRAAIFVSTDGGKTYDDHTLDPPPPSDGGPSDDAVGGMPDNPPPLDFGYLELSPEYSRLTIDESGTLGIVAETQTGYTWVTTDADVHLSNIGVPPEPAVLGGYGKRLVAMGYGSNDGATHAYESLDGGASFSEITTTAAIVSFTQGDTTTVCSAGGCLFGDSLARVGWEGEAETAETTPEQTMPEQTGKLGASIACELVAKSQWTPVKNTVVGGVIYPRLSDMNRGKTAWSLVTQDPATRAVDVTTASMPDKESDPSAVTSQRLMGPLQPGVKTAWAIRPQAEGYIAARVTIPTSKGKSPTGKPLNGLEVNWANFYTGTFGHRTLSDAGTWTPSMLAIPNIGDMALTETTLTPSLLSIAGSGVVFRASQSSPRSLFFDAQARTTPFDYPEWGMLGLTAPIGSDAAMAGGELFAAGFVSGMGSDGSILSMGFARAHKPSGSASYEAVTTTFASASGETDWVYLDTTSGIQAIYPEADGNKPEAFAMILKQDGSLGEPIALPTLNDLPEKPRACTADDRKNTARAFMPVFSKSRAVPLFPNGRRAVVVTDGAKDPKALTVMEPIWFLSDGAILHGTPKDPCLAGMRASAAGRGLVAVIAGDMAHAWMFRPTPAHVDDCDCDPINDPMCSCGDSKKRRGKPAPGAPTSSVEWRPMTCRVKPELTPPPELSGNVLVQSPEDVF